MEPDETGQNPTESSPSPTPGDARSKLTSRQIIALAALLAGDTVKDAALKAKVARQTVSEWTNRDRNFRAALDEGRSLLFDSAVGKAYAIAWDGINSLGTVITSGDNTEKISATRVLLAWLVTLRKPTTGGTAGDPMSIAELLALGAEITEGKS